MAPIIKTDQAAQPMTGLKCWIITDGKQGMIVQGRGIADALGLDAELKTVAPKGFSHFAAPWGPVSKGERFGQTGAQFSPPWPDVVIATGRSSIPYVRKLGKLAGARTYCVVLQDPKTGPGTADLIWVPRHDTRRGGNVITTLTAPHSFTQSRLAELRANPPAEISNLSGPRITVVLGGKNAVYKFTLEDDRRFGLALASLAEAAGSAASFMITSSRRTHTRLLDAVLDATSDAPRIVYTGDGSNLYPDFLANADIVVVTADSVNMVGEATATGKPVYVFEPSGGSDKFTRFHDALRHYGATQRLPDTVKMLPEWRYEPLDSAAEIAREIESRWLQRSL